MNKLYSERPKSYRLHCDRRNPDSVNAALDQLGRDHPEVFGEDERHGPYCNILSNKYGYYVLKNPDFPARKRKGRKKAGKRKR